MSYSGFNCFCCMLSCIVSNPCCLQLIHACIASHPGTKRTIFRPLRCKVKALYGESVRMDFAVHARKRRFQPVSRLPPDLRPVRLTAARSPDTEDALGRGKVVLMWLEGRIIIAIMVWYLPTISFQTHVFEEVTEFTMRLFKAIKLAMHYMRTGEVPRDFQTPAVSMTASVTVIGPPDDVREILFSRRSSEFVTVDDRTYYIEFPSPDMASLHTNVMLNVMRLSSVEPPWFEYMGRDSSGDKDIFVLTALGVEATDNYRKEHCIS